MKKLNQTGFTLLETLVAVIVLSISIVMIMQLFSSNLKVLPANEQYFSAVILARAKMEEALLSRPLVPGKKAGQFDDFFSWEMAVVKEEQAVSFPFDIFKIDINVSWPYKGRKKEYHISTLESVAK
jgi:general secretion pathway protein I